MKRLSRTVFVIVSGLILSLSTQEVFSQPGMGKNYSYMEQTIESLPKQELSKSELDGLLKMREEEKLARDVYTTLGEKWNIPVFKNIAKAEQVHCDAIEQILKKYDIDSPVKDEQVGIFASEEMAQMYESLVKKGDLSMTDALTVGATIEDLDIKDLYDLSKETDNEDVSMVYANLAKGSRNHMRAFTNILNKRGVEYTAQYLSEEDYTSIINSEHERGVITKD